MATMRDDEPATELVNPLDGLLGYQLRRASAAMLSDLMRVLADLDLRVTEASVILLIDSNPDITQREIGRTLGIQRANMAPLVAGLDNRAIIDRARADGRSQALRLSGHGSALARVIRARIADHEARFLVDLSTRDRSRLIRMLRRIWTE
jgi:DNA-binding MarR family transcriptional regulator